MNQLHDLADALASSDNQPRTTFEALCAFAQHTVGVKLFTLMTFDARTRGAQRIFSNMPDAYPVSGTKPRPVNRWAETVLDRGETYVMNDIETIAEVFFDHELIKSLGCESCINIPVIVAGEVLGTMNCLHEAGHYTPERVALSESLKLPGAACFLLARAKAAGAI